MASAASAPWPPSRHRVGVEIRLHFDHRPHQVRIHIVPRRCFIDRQHRYLLRKSTIQRLMTEITPRPSRYVFTSEAADRAARITAPLVGTGLKRCRSSSNIRDPRVPARRTRGLITRSCATACATSCIASARPILIHVDLPPVIVSGGSDPARLRTSDWRPQKCGEESGRGQSSHQDEFQVSIHTGFSPPKGTPTPSGHLPEPAGESRTRV